MKLSLRFAISFTTFFLIILAHSAVSFAQGVASSAQGDVFAQQVPGGGGECCYYNSASPLNERVLVVYNKNIPESLDVANHYAMRRAIPSANLLGIEPSSDTEISWTEFLNKVKGPIQTKLTALDKRNILYIVFSYRTPFRIGDVPAATISANCAGGDPRCKYGTALDQFVADVWDQTGLWTSDTTPQTGNAYYALSQSKANQYRPFVSLADFREQSTSLTYSVWRLDGPTAAIAKGVVDKAIEAETSPTGLSGVAYFDKNTGNTPLLPDTPGLEAANWDIYRAAEFAREAGFYVTEDNSGRSFGTAPAPSAPNAALYVGTYNLGLYNDAFTWKTGAIGFDFNSDAAASFRFGNTWCGGALSKGITVTGGAIDEPYAPLLPKYDGVVRNLFEGANVGDALARNTPALKWRLLNFGDPLYRPSLGRASASGVIPSNWSFVDINANPGTVNALRDTAKMPAAYQRDSLVVRSYGQTLYGTNDSCNFIYTPMSADSVGVEVRVGRTEPYGDGAVAGVMFRESAASNSKEVSLLITAGGQLHMRERSQTGQDSVLTTFGTEYEHVYPMWLRLERVGNSLCASKSADGGNWTQVACRTISMTSPALVGLVTLGGTTTPNKAFYDNLVVYGATY